MYNTQILSSQNRTSVLSFLLCMLLAMASLWSNLHLLYGMTLSLTSLFVLLGIRSFRYGPALLGSAAIYTIGVLALKHPYIIYIGLLEAAVVGLLIRKYRNRMFLCDAVFWLLIGMPVGFWLHYKYGQYSTGDTLLIVLIMTMNGLFNALFAEILYQYNPFRRKISTGNRISRPYSFSQILFHLSIGILMMSFLFHILTNSVGSFKEASYYAKQLSIKQVNEFTRKWESSLSLAGNSSEAERIEKLRTLLMQHHATASITIMDQENTILATSTNDPIGSLFNLSSKGSVKSLSNELYLSEAAASEPQWYYQLWNNHYFVHMNAFSFTDWTIVIKFPLNYFQNYLFNVYSAYFYYAVVMAAIAAFITYIISRRITKGLTQLANTTRNLPLKLKQMRSIEWTNTNSVEIHSLAANFKHMSNSLIHMFEESKKNNERLQAQAFMLQQSEEQLRKLAYYDSLTGLPNQLEFKLHIQNLLSLRSGTTLSFAVIIADINRFKQINDTMGHMVGDLLIQQTALRFSGEEFKKFTIFRANGDEFMFIVSCKDEAELQAEAELICSTFAEPFMIDHMPLFLTISVGISLYPHDGQDADTLIRNARIAMFNARDEGDGGYRFFQPKLVSVMTELMQLENGLYNALLHHQFSLHYQPKIDAATGSLCGIEALIRWTHPKLGMVPPDKFIPLAERSGLILEIDRWVFREACRQNKAWQDAGFQRICVSVNISARHFYQGNLTEMIIDALEETGLDAQYISIEITEGVFMQNIEKVIETISYLRSLGIHISIDDFGTGYSSLNQLQLLPISDVKLDRSFIQGITNDEKKSSIVRAIIELVHSMNMKVVAEGVETADESKFCMELNCDELQGYYYSKPLPAKQFEALFEARK